MRKFEVENIKIWAKECFKDFEPLSKGFCLPFITVTTDGITMEICAFDSVGRTRIATFLNPDSKRELLKRLSHHCGVEAINDLLKNNFAYVYNT